MASINRLRNIIALERRFSQILKNVLFVVAISGMVYIGYIRSEKSTFKPANPVNSSQQNISYGVNSTDSVYFVSTEFSGESLKSQN